MDNKIRKSLIDSKVESVGYNPKIVINEKNKGIKNTIINNFEESDRFDIAVSYVVWSGFSLLKEHLKKFDSKSRFILTTEGFVTDPNSLRELLELDIQVKLYSPDAEGRGFHLKSYLFEKDDERKLLIGSNNISLRALGEVHEMAMEVEANKDGYVIEKYSQTFNEIWEDSNALFLTEELINNYAEIFKDKKKMDDTFFQLQLEENKIRPNPMQKMALIELEACRREYDKALVIAATGTGKTYLSAFDVQQARATKVLFLVHNRLILSDAMSTFGRVFGKHSILELDSTTINKMDNATYIFTTDRTAFNHLFDKIPNNYFDYIIYDEAHKIGESTQYNSLINFFKPNFTLGITATPERTDKPRFLFETFNYNIPYEIRLMDAMNAQLVCPFNYYGYNLEEKLLNPDQKFNYIELVKYLKTIISDIGHYGLKLKGLVFASNISEANTLSNEFNKIGIKTVSAVSGSSTHEEIGEYINSLKSDDAGTIELIVTVNKFNEGIDIPDLNTIIMLRNTTSSIIYLQQLGRGLRRTNDPDKFVTVIDIIGNDKNNYTIAEVLTGNETRDKRALLKYANEGFEEVSPFINVKIEQKAIEKIIESISNNFTAQTQLKQKMELELQRYKEIPTLIELYNNPVFKEMDLLQLLFKNFHTPFAKYYKEKYSIEIDNLFVKNFFTLISQFTFRGFSKEELREYVAVLEGGKTNEKRLLQLLLPNEIEDGIKSAVNSNYNNVISSYPKVFELDSGYIKMTSTILENLKENNALELFYEHVDLFKELSKKESYVMKTFDLVDKADFLLNVGSDDCYMNVTGEKIDHEKKVVYATIQITDKETMHDNIVISEDQILYYTKASSTEEAARSKVEKFLELDYKFKICATFPHMGYPKTAYFNLGQVKYDGEPVLNKISDKKFNYKMIFKLEEKLPLELLLYKKV